MFRQVFNSLQGAILSGELPAGYKLPSTRELASQLHVSRNVILEAYELLLAEGYITGRSGAGTYVAQGACLLGFTKASPLPLPASLAESTNKSELDFISFRTGLPALNLFPMKNGALFCKVYAWIPLLLN